ncbi:MAG: endonuclease [Candidatus Thermoplasmatota archaeon]
MGIAPKDLYERLFGVFGLQQWWPVDKTYHQKHHSDPRFEIIIGAILTQNTAWTNVEKALGNLKKQHIFTSHAIAQIAVEHLKLMIQPSGFFNQKAHRLKWFSSYLENQYGGDLQMFFSRDTREIRDELLLLPGIGPETADSMLLYAGDHPVFVVDAYTRRICHRLPYPIESDSYEVIQDFFDSSLKSSIGKEERIPIYKEFHALLVQLAKQYCWKKKPACDTCPLTTLCEKLL